MLYGRLSRERYAWLSAIRRAMSSGKRPRPLVDAARRYDSAVSAGRAGIAYGTGDRGVHPGDVVLDCGANVGTFVKTALENGAERVVAIEPAPQTLECLRRNLAAEIAAHRVVVYPKGVWNKEDVLILNEHNDTTAMDSFVIAKDTHKGIAVPLTTIDKLVSELGLDRVDFIKMDIEGAEQNALAGGRETILKWKPRMEMSVNHLPEDPVKVPQLILGMQPDYKQRFLLCDADWNRWLVRANIIYFY